MSTDARPSVPVHANEELLEEYSFGRICEPQLGWLEEHLLICPQCRTDLQGVEEYKILMKTGLASFESERQAGGLSDLPVRAYSPVEQWYSLLKALSRRFALPRIPMTGNLLAAALVLVLTGATVAWWRQSAVSVRPAATVKLIALRGGEGDEAWAPSGRPLDLVFNRTDLAADLSYRAEVVDASGRQMWSGNVRIADQNLSIHLAGPLSAGVYWVRLYTSAGELLREFGLRVG